VKKYVFPLRIQKNADVSIFSRFKTNYLGKNEWLPPVSFVDPNSPRYSLLFQHGPYLEKKPLYFVGTVLEAFFLCEITLLL